MNLYRIYRTDEIGYDEYDSAVVAAESEADALTICPNGDFCDESSEMYGTWQRRSLIGVELLGIAKEGTERGPILTSFNAG